MNLNLGAIPNGGPASSKFEKVSLFEKIIASQFSFEEKMKFKPLVINTINKIFMKICVFLLLIKLLIKLRLENGKKKVNT